MVLNQDVKQSSLCKSHENIRETALFRANTVQILTISTIEKERVAGGYSRPPRAPIIARVKFLMLDNSNQEASWTLDRDMWYEHVVFT